MNWIYVRYGVLIAVSTYTWFKFLKEWYEKLYQKHLLFLKMHNCVVMYNSAGKRIGGWPCDDSDDPADDDIKGINVIRQYFYCGQYESLLYFIRTAKESLYIATMFIHVQCIVDELLAAHERNVIIKIIVDYNYNKSGTCIQQLQRAGIEVLYYVPPNPDQCSRFHYNSVVKDFSRDTQDGYLCTVLLNWSVNSAGVVSNYEIFNFISKFELVAQFYDNFEDAWNTISEMNETNDYIKDTLREINMYQ
ncbi:hypothetical protein RI129_011348 [Pyrocoelia pectoralis]|uniref:Mitochondrial cardiolipin hydrolase n=1 Tax=Pyrocoelia pectoralis TaxID=417401 RepID=A0AAN7ZFG2_9COLE